MRFSTHFRARSATAVLSIALTALSFSPVVALSSAKPECAAPAHADGPRDTSGRLREPVQSQAIVNVPLRAQGRGGPGFSETVDVYFHVITSGANGAVSTGTLAQQMSVLNKGFAGQYGGADTGLKFSLADVDFTENAAWYAAGPGSPEETAMKQTLKQGGPADDKEHSRWRYSLMNWGHDPLKR